MTTVNVQVSADADTCNDTNDGNYPGFQAGTSLTSDWFWGDKSDYDPRSNGAGMIFRSVSVSSGATWDTVTNPPTITFVPSNSATAPPIQIYWNGEESGSPSSWADGAGPFDRTATSVPAGPQSYSPAADSVNESPSLAGIMQEISDTIGALTDISLWSYSDSAGSYGKGPVYDFGDNSSAAPTFNGDYTAGSPPPATGVVRAFAMMGMGR